jgi:hypothetical protein
MLAELEAAGVYMKMRWHRASQLQCLDPVVTGVADE